MKYLNENKEDRGKYVIKTIGELKDGEQFSMSPSGKMMTFHGITEVPCAGVSRVSHFVDGYKWETRVDGPVEKLLDCLCYSFGIPDDYKAVEHESDDELIDLALSTTYRDSIVKYAAMCKKPENREYILSFLDDWDAVWENLSTKPLREHTNNSIKNLKIDDCQLSARIKTICKCNEIETVGEMCDHDCGFWMRQRCFGRKYVQEIYDFLKSFGFEMPGAKRFNIKFSDSDRVVANCLEIPGTIRTYCRWRDIDTVDDLAEVGADELMSQRAIGKIAVEKTRRVLKDKFGLDLK